MNMNTLKQKGFGGFLSIEGLRRGAIATVPEKRGTYAVVREPTDKPTYLEVNPAWHHKGRDPTVSCSCLEKNWVPEASVLYFGETGGLARKPGRTLKKRIGELVDFGDGKPASHWGGRLIWQLSGSENFLIAWCVTNDPITLKVCMIKQFITEYCRYPFANLRRLSKRQMEM